MRNFLLLAVLLFFFCTGTLYAQYSLWTWGYNGYGSLGNGYWYPSTNQNPEVIIPEGISCFDDWTTIAAGREMTLALRQNGTLWAWGISNEMGIPTSQMEYSAPYYIQSMPVQISTDTDWATLRTEDGVSFAVKTDGSLWAWGQNDTGALGDGTYETRKTPVRIGTDADWKVVIPTGDDYLSALGLKTDGTLWSWGERSLMLGDGAVARRNTPVRVGTDADWAYISERGYQTVAAIKTDGSLWMWGRNDNSQLGLGAALYGQDQPTPQRVGAATDWKVAAPAYLQTTAIKTDGTLWTWGTNPFNSSVDHVPVQIGNDTDWAAITNSFFYVLLLKTDGSLWYYRGEPGGGLSAVPVRMGTSGDWRTVSVGTQFAAALSVLPFDPMPTPVDLGDDIETCNPSVTLTPSIADGGLYKWTLPNGTVVYNRTPPFTFEASASGTYKLAVTKAGCRSSDDIRVTLHSSAPLTLQIDGTPIPGCPGHYDLTQPLTFRNTSPDAGTQPFTWAMGDGTTTNGAQPQYTYGRPGTYTVALSTTTCPRSITRDVVIQHVLSLGDDLVTCMPAISLSAPISGANSYTWVMPTGNTTGETITAAATGIYTLSLVQYGCTQTDALHITFEPSGASGDFTITTLGTPVTEGATILAGVPFTLTGTLPASVPHQWSFDDGGTGNTHSIDHAYTDPGTYAVTLTAGSNHCAGTITKYLHVQDLIITDAISPNGDGKNDRLVITPFIYDAELKIMDRAGRTVYHATPYNNDFSGQNLESDVYYYELQLNEASKSYKGYVHVIK